MESGFGYDIYEWIDRCNYTHWIDAIPFPTHTHTLTSSYEVLGSAASIYLAAVRIYQGTSETSKHHRPIRCLDVGSLGFNSTAFYYQQK